MLESNRRRSAWPVHVLALVGYFLLTLLFTWPLALNLGAAIPGDSFDGWQNYWNQWWIKLALVDRLTSPLFTDILYAPTGVGLYFHTLNPLNGLATLPVQLSAGLIPAYNAVVFFSFVLGGYGMFLLARLVIGARTAQAAAAAFVAGMIYTLSPFHMAHLLGHMQVISLQWLPFYILYLLRGVSGSQAGTPALRADVRNGVMAGLFLAANGLSDWYFVLYLLLFTTLFLAWQWLSCLLLRLRAPESAPGTATGKAAFSMRLLWVTVRPSLVTAGVFVTLLGFWLLPMIQEARQFAFMVRPPADLYILSASLMDFLVPNRLHTLWRPASFAWIGNQIAPISERTISIGYVALGLAVAGGMFAWRKASFWFAAALLFLLLALGPQWHAGSITWEEIPDAVQAGQEIASWTPYALLNQWVPFMRVSRSVSRFALLVQLSIAVLAGMGLHGLLAWGRRTRAAFTPLAASAVVGAVVLGIGFEYWVAPYPLSPPDTPAYYTQLAAEEGGRAVLNLPMNYDRPGYLLYQTVHGKPLTVAYISRDDPRTLTERVPLLQHLRHLGPDIIDADPALVGPTVLADLGVGTVILDRYKMPGGKEREYTEATAGRIFAGQPPLFADERLTVYRVQPPPKLESYLELGPQHWGPLQESESRAAWRTVSGGPASVTVRHSAGPQHVLIRYRTRQNDREMGEGPAMRVLAGGAVLAELPPAADGGEVVIELPATGDGSDVVFVLEALDDVAGTTVQIEQLRLQ